MMSDVLDVVLTIFDCDRAWLVYPCDPEAATWQVPMERTRPKYPGVLPIGVELPLEPVGAAVFRILRAANSPVQFGPGSEHQVPEEVAQAFSVQSFIAMVLYPKVSQPWSFGLHQCSYPRIWAPEDQRLFQEIGRRLADSLTSLLSYRNLRQSERRLEEAERIAHVGWWDRDYDADSVALSDEACRIFGLPLAEQQWRDLAQWNERWLELVHPEDRPKTATAVTTALQGGPRYDVEYHVVQPGGEIHIIHSQGDVAWDESGRPRRMFGIMQDITELRQVEDELRRNREAALQFSEQLATLQEVTNQLSKAESSDDLYRQAVQLGRSRLGFDRVSIWFIDEERSIMEGSFGTDEHGELRDERNAQIKFRHTGLAWRVFSHKESMALVEYGPLYNHLGQKVGEGDNAIAALWDGDDVIGTISVDNLFTHQPITEHPLEVLRLYATTLGHLITRKRAEDARRVSEERYRALYRDNPSMFFTLDSEGVIISVNTFGARQLGYTIGELEGQSVLKVFYEEDRTAETTQLQRCVQNPGQTNHWQFRKVHKDGRLLWVEEFVRAITNPNGAIDILVVCQDITDRKQAEIERERLLAQIQEQAQQVQNIIDTVPEGVILLNEDQFITLTNPAARQYLTLLAPEFQDGRLTQLGQRSLNELLTSPPKGLWHEILTDDLVFETITRPVENGPHNGGWVLVLRDITQERDIQQRVQRQERLAAVGQLAAGIAHDFNNILAVIALYTQLISRTVEMPARIQERLHTIEQQIRRATDLIQQILDFSRQSVLERKPFDLLPFMEELVVLLERTLPEHILIELDHAAEAYFIQADPSRIQQVMMNLAVNARDAMPEGGHLQIRLVHMQTEVPRPMPVQDLPPGDWVQIEITDSGDGIPPEVLSHIFEPFFTTKEVGEGTGLGLAQVYGIVQQHEGYIDVTTEDGQGTTFTLYFPALNTGDNTPDTYDKAMLQLGQGQRVLVVEDDEVTREALLDSLAELNYEVLTATNGREALTILATKATEVDLVLSDAVMPEMGGIALFHAMQEQKLTIPIVLLTGHPLSKEMENLKMLGLAGWLPKPPDLVNLSHLLAEVLTASPY
jgi:PAS domain S-box-containing protein